MSLGETERDLVSKIRCRYLASTHAYKIAFTCTCVHACVHVRAHMQTETRTHTEVSIPETDVVIHACNSHTGESGTGE